MRADWQTHLKKVRNACVFRRIRGHGLLDNDMNVILPNDGTFNATSAGPPATPDEGGATHYSFRNAGACLPPPGARCTRLLPCSRAPAAPLPFQ